MIDFRKYMLGIHEIDAEHALIINLVNDPQFLDGSRLATDIAFGALYDYVFSHLLKEEWALFKWSGYTEHQTRHMELEFKLDEIMASHLADKNSIEVSKDLKKFIMEDFLTHIETEDSKYVSYIKERIAAGNFEYGSGSNEYIVRS